MGEHIYTYLDPPDERHVERILDCIRHDGVIAISSGTNWVFAASPTSKRADQRIRRLKPEHPQDRPFALLCADISMATSMTLIQGTAYRVLKRIWPGPFTVILKASHDLPRVLKTRRRVVGVRIPDDPLARLLLERLGGPLMVSTVPTLATGAPTMGFEVWEAFGDGLDLVVDLGEPVAGVETTVVDFSGDSLEVLREGAGRLDLL